MAKKKNAAAEAPVATTETKRTPAEKAQRKADKTTQRAGKALTDSSAEKKSSQKQTLKAAAKQLQKELDARMNEVVTRIRKETKAKLKEVIKEATSRLDVDTERMFEQALGTLVRHYDSLAPGRSGDLNFPAPAAEAADDKGAAKSPATGLKVKSGAPARKAPATSATAPTKETTAAKRPSTGSQATAKATPAASRSTGRAKWTAKNDGNLAADLSTPVATTNDSVAVDNV